MDFSFIRTARIAVAAIGIMAGSAAHAEFVGGGAVFNPVNCSWPTQVEMATARYVPDGSDGMNTSEVVLNFAVGGVHNYVLRGDMEPKPGRWQAARGRSIWGRVYDMTPRPRLRVRERVGINWSGEWPDARDIRLQFDVRNFNGERGCRVSVALNLTKMR